MAHSLSKESDRRAIFNPENHYMLTFVHSWASSKENKWSTDAIPLSAAPYPLSITHMHMHTLVKHHLFTFSLFYICHLQCKNGCVTFWWRKDDHGSLSSPWRMDLIHSILVCAFDYTADRLSWSIFRLYEIQLHHVACRVHSWAYMQRLGWNFIVGCFSRNVFRVPHKCSKLNWCLKWSS